MTLFGKPARALAMLTLAMTTAACGHNAEVSVTGGEARAIEPPEYEIKGATDFDQRWIDRTVEAGVAGLGWQRPKERPAAWDAKPAPRAVAAPPVPAKKKRSLLKRMFKRGEAGA